MNDDYNPPKQNVSYSMSGAMGTGQMAGAASFGNQQPGSPSTAQQSMPDTAIKDITANSFMADVIEASKLAPVIVDFWAPWCEPCKQLGPIIEKTILDVVASGFSITLCKMDVEKHPSISQQMGIQSIPAVVAFMDGKPADAFMGAKSAAEVQAFVDKIAALGPPPQGGAMAEELAAADQLAATGQTAEAAELYSVILSREPGNLDAMVGLGQCYVAVGEIEKAQHLVDQVPQDQHDQEPLTTLIKVISLAQQGAQVGDLSELKKAVAENPKDFQSRFDYALGLNANGDREQAADQLIKIIQVDRQWKDDGARVQLLEFFEAWGNMDPATLAGRRALSSILFS